MPPRDTQNRQPPVANWSFVDGDYLSVNGEPRTVAAVAEVAHEQTFEGRGGHFPLRTAKDYARVLKEAGFLTGDEALRRRPDLVAVVQAQWHTTGGDGCLFAAGMSARRDEAGWRTIVLESRDSAEHDAAAVAAHTAEHLKAPETQILSVVLPHVATAERVCALSRELEAHAGWSLDTVATEHDGAVGPLVLIGLRVALDDSTRSEVLGFGPLVTFPHTRRAPFLELAIRVSLADDRPEPHRAHMADAPRPVGLDEAIAADPRRTPKVVREERLPPEQDARAKARVTFTLPEALWRP